MRRHPLVQVLSSELVHAGRVFSVVRERFRQPSGLEARVEVVDHPGAVCVAPLLDSGEIVCVRQYRHAAGDWLLEIPAGRVEHGEERASAARRELEEETGYRAGSLELLTEFFAAPGFCSEWMSVYVARGLVHAGAARRGHDPDVELEVVAVAPRELLGRARDAKTIIAAALLADACR
jgi:ADP-ribose pyrophosphatase